MFKKRYKGVKYPTVRQLYNWINNEKIDINKYNMCYKRRKKKYVQEYGHIQNGI